MREREQIKRDVFRERERDIEWERRERQKNNTCLLFHSSTLPYHVIERERERERVRQRELGSEREREVCRVERVETNFGGVLF